MTAERTAMSNLHELQKYAMQCYCFYVCYYFHTKRVY